MSLRWDARDYARHSTGQREWAKELLGKIRLRRGDSVLDIGCGDGVNTAELAGLVSEGSVLGIDSSPEMIALARERFPAERHPNLTFREGDASNLRFRERFTFVFSNAALHWVVDHGPVLAGIERSLKPGGRILLQMGGRGNAREVFEACDRLIRKSHWGTYFDGFAFPYGFHGPEEYRAWLAEAGLEPLRVALIPKEMVHPDREAFVGWIRTTWLPYTERVPEAERPAFIAALADEYLTAHSADDAGRCRVEMRRLEAEAEKPPLP